MTDIEAGKMALLRLAASPRGLMVRGPSSATWDLWEPLRNRGFVTLDDGGLEEGLELRIGITARGVMMARLIAAGTPVGGTHD